MSTGWSPASSSQKSSGVDSLTVGANYGGKQAHLCSSGRWPVENNPEESKQVPAKNFGLGRGNDLWTCKRYWRTTSGGQPWAELSWPITQRKGKSNSWQMKQNMPFFHMAFFMCLIMLSIPTASTRTCPNAFATFAAHLHTNTRPCSLVDQHWCYTQTLHLCQSCLQNITRIFPYQKDKKKKQTKKSEGSPTQNVWNTIQLQDKCKNTIS